VLEMQINKSKTPQSPIGQCLSSCDLRCSTSKTAPTPPCATPSPRFRLDTSTSACSKARGSPSDCTTSSWSTRAPSSAARCCAWCGRSSAPVALLTPPPVLFPTLAPDRSRRSKRRTPLAKPSSTVGEERHGQPQCRQIPDN
jgi:hypothetical protein